MATKTASELRQELRIAEEREAAARKAERLDTPIRRQFTLTPDPRRRTRKSVARIRCPRCPLAYGASNNRIPYV